MTLVHELCHGGIKDEFWADVLAIRVGIRMGFPKAEIMGHIFGRRAAVGIEGEKALFRFAQRKFFIINERAKKIYLRRIEKLGRKAREKEEMRFAKRNEKRFAPSARLKIQGMRINPERLFRSRPIRRLRSPLPRSSLPMRRNRPRRPF
jgi:pyruvate-formate lyase